MSREQIWAGQGVALDKREREVILRHPSDNVKVSGFLCFDFTNGLSTH